MRLPAMFVCLFLILILMSNSQSSSWSIAWMGVVLYGADVNLDSSALKDAGLSVC